MKFLAFLILFSAIVIASCAAYFSVVGLNLLFVGSGISIIIMGIALEVGKFITVTFLKQKWNEIDMFLKTYLVLATIVLMGITSVGIYGYLSAGYNATAVKVQELEQNIDSNIKKIDTLKIENERLKIDTTNQNDIDLINTNKNTFVEQQLKLIEQKEEKIKSIRANFTADKKSSDDLIAAKNALDVSKNTIDSEINKELEQIKLYNNRLILLDEEVQSWLKQGDRGFFRENGTDKARTVKLAQEKERNLIDAQIKEIQDRIQILRDEYKAQTEIYNTRVLAIENRLINQTSNVENQIKEIENEIIQIRQGINVYIANVESSLNEQVLKKEELLKINKQRILENEEIVNNLLTNNFNLQQQIIQTDVGTFKFVASSLGLTLDKTVTYFIAAIMLVFDPLAICLVLCFNFLIKEISNKNKTIYSTITEKEPVSIKDQPSVTPTPSEIKKTETMKSSEIIFGKRKEKPKHPPAEGEVKRIEDILEQQRKEKAERESKPRPA